VGSVQSKQHADGSWVSCIKEFDGQLTIYGHGETEEESVRDLQKSCDASNEVFNSEYRKPIV